MTHPACCWDPSARSLGTTVSPATLDTAHGCHKPWISSTALPPVPEPVMSNALLHVCDGQDKPIQTANLPNMKISLLAGNVMTADAKAFSTGFSMIVAGCHFHHDDLCYPRMCTRGTRDRI